MPRWPKQEPRLGVDEYGRTPLWELAFTGDVAGVQRELKSGADPSAGDDAGYTPLHIAIQERHLAVIEALLAAGADSNSADKHGNGPLWTAVMDARGDNRIVVLLLRFGADPQHKNAHGRSPYDMAITIGHGLEESFNRGGSGKTEPSEGV
jgi:ankyrin repeat protein